MRQRRFRQVDVFAAVPFGGNPVAVVIDGEGVDDAEMQAFTRWSSLSEATFLLPPRSPRADYRVRIFTADRELPFAGHPTLGSAHAWLQVGGVPARAGKLVQECEAGLIDIRQVGTGLAFAAPPLLRAGPVADDLAARILRGLRVDPSRVQAMQWVDNGPGWIGVLLDSARTVLEVGIDRDELRGLGVGIIGAHAEGGPADYEVRAFYSADDVFEDPVTGSLNASLAQWLIGAGIAPPRYRARQGTAMGRTGTIDVVQKGQRIWIGGTCVTRIEGVANF
jgi:PhzF family phenazine biosynthesis protein